VSKVWVGRQVNTYGGLILFDDIGQSLDNKDGGLRIPVLSLIIFSKWRRHIFDLSLLFTLFSEIITLEKKLIHSSKQ